MKYKIARFVLFLSSTLLVAYGLWVILDPTLITHNLELYADLKLTKLDEKYQKMLEWINMAMQLLACFNIIAGLTGIVAIYKSFKVKEKWLLLIIFICTVLGYAAPIAFDLRAGVIRWMEVIEIGSFILTVIAFGVLIPEFNNGH